MIVSRVAGVKFEPHRENLIRLYRTEKNFTVKLLKENHPKDPNAIAVMMKGDIWDSFWHVGYLPREKTSEILRIGLKNIEADFLHFNTYDGSVVGLLITMRSEVEPPPPKVSRHRMN